MGYLIIQTSDIEVLAKFYIFRPSIIIAWCNLLISMVELFLFVLPAFKYTHLLNAKTLIKI